MAYVNGTASHDAAPTAALAGMAGNQDRKPEPERTESIRNWLSEPFDPAELKWRVAATSKQQANGAQKRGQLVAYADPRAYTDRLNAVFGEWGWSRSYTVQVVQNFERRGSREKKEAAIAAKVVVVCTVTICGLGAHTGMGEEWADDENAATSAEAQSFKRACACFGLGRYLYDLGKAWVDLDEHNRPLEIPELPDWAQPSGGARETQSEVPRPRRGQPKQSIYRDEMLAKVRELRVTAGRGLSAFVLKQYAGGAAPERAGNPALTVVVEKLADIGKGVDRLRTAAALIGDARYAVICRELNLASGSIDDIPHRAALAQLLARAEAEAAGQNSSKGSRIRTMDISTVRGHLLQAARKIADKTGKGFGAIIAEASDGKITLEQLRDLTDADAAFVAAVTSKIAGGSRS